jgi:PAS domain S-box-containing protein
MVARDGRVIWFRDEAILCKDPGTGISYYHGVMYDITDRKLAEARTRESEERYRELIEKSPGFICIHDLEGVFLYVNPAVSQVTGYEPSELIGRKISEFLAPSVQDAFPAYLNRIRSESVAKGMLRLCTKTGEELVWAYRNYLCTEAGKQYVLGHAQDITERVQAEEELNRTTHLLISLMDSLPLGILVEDPFGRVHYVNKMFCRMFGCAESSDDLLGLDHSRLIRELKRRFRDPEGFVRSSEEIPMAAL